MLPSGLRQRNVGKKSAVNRLTGSYLGEYHLLRRQLFPNKYVSKQLHSGDFPRLDKYKNDKPEGTSLFDALTKSIPTWPIVVLAMVVILLVGVGVYFFKKQAWLYVMKLMEWMELHPWPGILAYVAFATAGTILSFPESLFTVPAGFVFAKIFGKVLGFLIAISSAFVGVYAGTVIAFLISRVFVRPCVGSYIQRSDAIKTINNVLKKSGTRLVFLIRIAPMPGQLLLTYLLGLTTLPIFDLLVGSLGMFIGIIQYCLAGASLQSLESMDDLKENPMGLVIMVISLGIILYGVHYLSRMAKEEMQLTTTEEIT